MRKILLGLLLGFPSLVLAQGFLPSSGNTVTGNQTVSGSGSFGNTISSTMNDGGTTLLGTGNAPVTFKSGVSNSAAAVGTIVDTTNSLNTTSGAKLCSIRNAGSEVAYFSPTGATFYATSVGPSWGTPAAITATVTYDGANRISLSPGAGAVANQWGNGNTAAPNILISNRTNASSAIGTNINTANTFNITGQKLLSVQNNSTEKFYIDKDGQTSFSAGGYLFSGVGNANEALIAGGATNAAGGANWTSRNTGTVGIYGFEAGGTFGVWVNAGTTSGSTFTPTKRLTVDVSGTALASDTLATCSSTNEGAMARDTAAGVATGARTRLCVCTSNGSSVYAWQNIVSGTVGTTTTCSP